ATATVTTTRTGRTRACPANSVARRMGRVLTLPMRIRPVTPDDAETILDIQSAHEIPLIGRPNATLEDVIDDLADPHWNIETDGWLAFAGDGTPIGWAWASRKGPEGPVDISVSRRPGHDEVAEVLWDKAQRRAGELIEGAPIDVGIFPNDELMQG